MVAFYIIDWIATLINPSSYDMHHWASLGKKPTSKRCGSARTAT